MPQPHMFHVKSGTRCPVNSVSLAESISGCCWPILLKNSFPQILTLISSEIRTSQRYETEGQLEERKSRALSFAFCSGDKPSFRSLKARLVVSSRIYERNAGQSHPIIDLASTT
jgi:hypothetical protein